MMRGLEIIPTEHLTPTVINTWTRKPRSKKRRIRDKWRKDPKNYELVVSYPTCRVGNMVFMHPEAVAKIRHKLQGAVIWDEL